MSNKKTLIISILAMLSIVVLVVAIILFSVNNKEKQLQENMKIIRSNYASFSNNITDNDAIRKKITEKINEFNHSSYEDEIGEYEEALNKYDKNIKYLDNLVKDMESRCEYDYEDLNTKLLCKGYAGLYESTVNKYIAKVIEYNNKVEEYNKKENKEHKLHKPVHEDFIDYDKDGEYMGSK